MPSVSKALCVIGSLIVGSVVFASAQDDFGGHAIIFDPGDPIIYMDFASMYPDSGGDAGHAAPPSVSPAQARQNLARLNTHPSSVAEQLAQRLTLEQFEYEEPPVQEIVRSALHDQDALNAHRTMLQRAGFDPDNLADTITAYALATYALAHTGQANWREISPDQIVAARQSVRTKLSQMIPAQLSDVELRAALEQTQTEHLLQKTFLRLSHGDAPDDREFVRNWLVDRAEDYAMMNVRATALDKEEGFVER